MDGSRDVMAPPADQLSEIGPLEEYQAQDAELAAVVSSGASLQGVEIARLLWEKRHFLVCVTIAGMILSTLLAFVLPKRYTATTRLMPPDYSSTASLTANLPSLLTGADASGGSFMGFAGQLLGLSTPGDLLVGVLGSTTVGDRIVNRFELMKLYSARYPEDARKRLENITTVKQDTKTGIISISVEDKDPKRAAVIAQAYVEELDRLLAQVNTSAAHRERAFLEERLSEVKRELDAAATEFSEFASKNTAIDIPEQAKAMVAAAADLQARLIAAESELKGLQQIYTDNNVRVRAVKARIAELQRQLDKFGGKDVRPTSGPSLASGQLYPSMRQLPLLGVKYLDLYRRSRIDEEVFGLLTKEYELAKVQEAREIPSVQVLDPPEVPQKKSFPPRRWIVLSGMCFSFLLGAAFLVGRAQWERLDSQHAWKMFGQEVFATIEASSWNSRAGLKLRSGAKAVRVHVTPFHRKHKPRSSDSA